VNRADLVEQVRSQAGLSKADSEAAVDAVLGTVMGVVQRGERVSLFGFGTFAPTSRAARTGRNPRTGDPVKIPASTGVRFTPSTVFKASLNPKKAAKKAPAAAAKAAKAPAKAAKAVKGAAGKAATSAKSKKR